MQSIFRWLVNALILSVIFAVIAGLGLLGAREWFLWRGVESFKSSIHEARRLTSTEGSSCTDEFGAADAITGMAYQQVRFTDDRRYNLELICPGFSDIPLASVPKVLSSFISKAPGSSGISLAQDQGAQYITLRVFGPIADQLPQELTPVLGWITKSTVVGWDEGQIVEKNVEDVVVTSLGPVAECSGYGYTCCDAIREVGEGLSIQNLNSCTGGCFERCIARPTVVALRSEPPVDWEAKRVIVDGDSPIIFGWSIEDAPTNGPWQVALDFGDGTTESGADLEGAVEHVYSCAEPECIYVVTLGATNSSGVSSAPTDVSKLEVLVRTQ